MGKRWHASVHNPPKAKVIRSNRVGRANKINSLVKFCERAGKAKLTTDSPTKRQFWRVIGGKFMTARRCGTEKRRNWLMARTIRLNGVTATNDACLSLLVPADQAAATKSTHEHCPP